jgi:hypothetical protein
LTSVWLDVTSRLDIKKTSIQKEKGGLHLQNMIFILDLIMNIIGKTYMTTSRARNPSL